MRVNTVCLRCHQKCLLIAHVIGERIVEVEDATINRTPPCSEACPLGMDIPGYVIAVSQGKFKEAREIIYDTNPLPLICGRVCHHPCEIECNKNVIDEPIAIQWIKRLVADYYLNSVEKSSPINRRAKEEVAIMGSGPAGLTAAHDLVKAGYGVTIYESAPIAGGMLATALPEFKLPQAMVQAEIKYIKSLGVKIETNMTIEKSLTIEDLFHKFNAVLIAIGCQKHITLNIPGSHLNGIYYALPLLKEIKEGKRIHLNGKVVIIGGGDTAMDVALTALRIGASEVDVTCIEARKDMPAHIWEIEKAEREGINIYPALAPEKFRNDGNGNVSGIDFKHVASTEINDDGKITWTLQRGPDSEYSMEANGVIVAIGQIPSISSLGEDKKLTITSRGTIACDPDTLACNPLGLFAAGDIIGSGTVVDSMASGRKAASSIIKYLSGSEQKNEASKSKQLGMPHFTVRKARQGMPILPPKEAVASFKEVELGYSEQIGIEEAKRCLNCITVCPKGLTIPDVMYHPDRLKYPLRRSGERGEGKWHRISWNEAINTIVGKLREIKEKHGPEAIHISCGSGQKHIGLEALTIARKLWPCPNTHRGRYTCVFPDVIANTVTFGDFITYEYGPDYAHSKCIVFWGSEPDVGTPAQARWVHRALREGSKMIVIDPRPIPMAKRADIWLRIRPGTDAALALAMINVIIREEIYDKQFVANWCVGFDKIKDHVREYTPERTAEITGLSKDDIVKAARMYATTKPGCVYVRCGVGAQQVTSTQTSRAISILIAICGNVDVPGGNLLYHRTFNDELFWHIYDMDKGVRGPADVEERRIGAKEYPLMNQITLCDIPGVVRAIEKGDVKALWCLANNLIVAEMDSRRIWDLMKNKLEFIFVSEFFMTPTAELADIVLPAAFYQEIDTLAAAFVYPSNYVTASKRVVDPIGECRDDREVAIEIAKKMGADVAPWETVEDFLNWRLKYLGLTYNELCKKPESRITFPRRFKRYENSVPPFGTATGKVELYSSVFEAIGLDPLPVFQEPPESPVSTPELFKEFPLIYTHYRLPSYMHSEGRQIERQRQLVPHAYLEINSYTASNLGINEGDWVYLETPKSRGKWRLTYKARLISELHPDVVAGPHAWWFPEKPGPEHGCFDSNINAVLSLDPPYDPAVGNVQCRAVLCRVEKLQSQ